jgi:hypothetical protein
MEPQESVFDAIEAERKLLWAAFRRALDDFVTRPRDTWENWEHELQQGYNAAIELDLGGYRRMRVTNQLNEHDELLQHAKQAWDWFTSDEDGPFSYRWVASYLGLPQDITPYLDRLAANGHHTQLASAQRHRVESGLRVSNRSK